MAGGWPDNPRMTILKVARLGHPILRGVARELTSAEILSGPTQRLVQDMKDTMDDYGGVGLAAPQVHESVQLVVMEFDDGNERYEVEQAQPFLVIFNPKIKVLDDEQAGYWEGCLSVPGLRGYVERPSRIQVDYLNERAEPVSAAVEGFLATVFQHEIDHLDGVLYVDKVASPEKLAFVEEFARYHAGEDEGDEADESDEADEPD